MTVQEAVLASQWLGLRHVIASHYQYPSHPDVQRFVQLIEAHRAAGDGCRRSPSWHRARPSSCTPAPMKAIVFHVLHHIRLEEDSAIPHPLGTR